MPTLLPLLPLLGTRHKNDSNTTSHQRTSRKLASGAAKRVSSLPLRIIAHNINGVALKDEEVIRSALIRRAQLLLLTETRIRASRSLFEGARKEFRWLFGSPGQSTRGGVAIAVHRSLKGVHVVKARRDSLFISVPALKGSTLFVGVVYLPPAGSMHAVERAELIAELTLTITTLKAKGKVVMMGDFNARCKANGDEVTNIEGCDLLNLCLTLGLDIANFSPVCSGEFTWERMVQGVLQRSTIDYCISTCPGWIKTLKISSKSSSRLGSDHKPLELTLSLKTRCSPTVPGRPRGAPDRSRRGCASRRRHGGRRRCRA